MAAGALGAGFLLLFYGALPMATIVETDLTYAVFHAALTGKGHRHLGAVNVSLLAPMLRGSIPGHALGQCDLGRRAAGQ